MAKKKLSNKEMIEIVGEYCGKVSIAYMNIRNYANAENYQVKAMFDAVMQREINSLKTEISVKQAEVQRLQALLNEVEQLLK